MKKLMKAAVFTDQHFGRKNWSEVHNKDCTDFIVWFCENVKNNPNIDHVIFLGDFFENRNNLNIATLNSAYSAVKLLDSLGIPVFFIIGNHDLYYRHNRTIYSTAVFQSLKNFHLIDKLTFIDHVGKNGTLFAPFLFPDEFVEHHELINKSEIVWGHLEYAGFIVTGENNKKEHGPDPDDFRGPRRIFSGHYHKRQYSKNIIYIGNPFAMDFSDANDYNRGYAIYDYNKDDIEFFNWEDGPTYVDTKLSYLFENTSILREKATVHCLADIDITLEESNQLREKFMSKFMFREFNLNEPSLQSVVEDTSMDLAGMETEPTDNIVTTLLGRVNEPSVKCDILIEIYNKAKKK